VKPTNKLDKYGHEENPMRAVCYKFSKKAMETFFRDPRLNYLFMKYIPKIQEEGYNSSENRRHGQKGSSMKQKVTKDEVTLRDLGKIDVKQYQEEYLKALFNMQIQSLIIKAN
jgi:hypothetical protein